MSSTNGKRAIGNADPAGREDMLVTIFERRAGWRAIDVGSLWRYRELLYFLTYRDIMSKYKQTVFGIAWTVVQPAMQMVIFSVVFGRFVGLDRNTGDIPYPVFVFCGLIAWSQFAKALSGAGSSVVANTDLITKVYFPRLIIPIASLGTVIVDSVIDFCMLLALMAFYGVTPGAGIVMLPAVIILLNAAALAVGIASSALTVTYRDVRIALGFVVQIWMYLTPVIYPLEMVPERYRWLLALNPMTGLISGFRYSLLNAPIDWQAFALGAGVTVVGLVMSAYYFRRVESRFADII